MYIDTKDMCLLPDHCIRYLSYKLDMKIEEMLKLKVSLFESVELCYLLHSFTACVENVAVNI